MNYLISILYSIKDVTAVLGLSAVFHIFFGIRKSKNKVFQIVFLTIPLIYSSSLIILFQEKISELFELLDGISLFYCLLSVPVFAQQKRKKELYFSVLFCLFTVDMIWSFVYTFLSPPIIIELIFYIVVFTTAISVLHFLLRTYPTYSFVSLTNAVPKWFIAVPLFFELTFYYKEFGISKTWYDAFYAISAVLILICFGLFAVKISGLVSKQILISEKLDEQLLSVQITSASDEELRKFRHDFKNHIIALNSFFENGDYDGAHEYLSEISDTVKDSIFRISTGNSVVNSLICVKQATAQLQNTEITFHGMIPNEGIKNSDMCICMGNLIDNALEECAKDVTDRKKTVDIHSHIQNSVLLITVTNPICSQSSREAIFSDELPETTKADNSAHGYGLKNVREIAEKYCGSLTLSKNENEFKAELIFYFSDLN